MTAKGCALGIAALAAVCVSHTSADTITVFPDGSGDYPNIAEAIEAAALGDTVQLGNGVFSGTGNHDLDTEGKAIVLRSISGNPETCILDGLDQHRLIYFSQYVSNDFIIEGIAFSRGWTNSYGGAIYAAHWSDVVIRNCIFKNNRSDFNGGAIAAVFGDPVIEQCTFIENSAYYEGGALWFDGYEPSYSDPILAECYFRTNEAQVGGAVTLRDTEAVISNCVFYDGYAEYYGGGCYSIGGAPHYADCSFEGNEAAWGAGIYGHDLLAERCWFYQNTAFSGGAGVVLRGGETPLVTNCIMAYNEAPYGGAGMVYQGAGTFSNCTMVFNLGTAGDGASAMEVYGESSAVLESCILAFGPDGVPVAIETGSATAMSCCDVYGNTEGDWVGSIEEQFGTEGNISENPLFCDVGTDSLKLHDGSSCAPYSPPNPECGLIGALPVGCEFQALDDSWFSNELSDLRVVSPCRGIVTMQLTNSAHEMTEMNVDAFDLTGRRVASVFSGSVAPGVHEIHWQGVRDDGTTLSNGVYLIQMIANGRLTGRGRLVLLR